MNLLGDEPTIPRAAEQSLPALETGRRESILRGLVMPLRSRLHEDR